jgi:hypothetical protein
LNGIEQLTNISIFRRTTSFAKKDFEKYRLKTLEANSNTAVFDYLMKILYINKVNDKKISYNILKEYWFINNIVFYTKKNFYMIKKFNVIISRLKSNGLINYWMSQETEIARKARGESGLEVLKIKHLEGVFEVFFIGLILAFLCFMIEKTIFLIKSKY